jgi:hypothetical protein
MMAYTESFMMAMEIFMYSWDIEDLQGYWRMDNLSILTRPGDST